MEWRKSCLSHSDMSLSRKFLRVIGDIALMGNNNKKGFTLIELLIVIAIMGILIGAIMVATGGARAKSQLGAFKAETKGSYGGLANICTTTGVAMVVPVDSNTTDWASAYAIPCSSNGNFLITATPANAGINCTANVTESGVAYVGPDC